MGLADFTKSIKDIDKSSFASETNRRQAVVQLQNVLARLQSPREKTSKLLHVDSYLIAAVKCLVKLDLFERWERAGTQPRTNEDLGSVTGADPALLGRSIQTRDNPLSPPTLTYLDRLLRLLTVSGMLTTDSAGRYEFSDFAQGLTSGRLSHSFIVHSFTIANSVKGLPIYLEATNFRNPTDSSNSSWAFNMGQPFMEYLKSNPEIFNHINEIMETKNIDTIPWFSFYPAKELMQQRSRTGSFLLTSVAALGTTLTAFGSTLEKP